MTSTFFLNFLKSLNILYIEDEEKIRKNVSNTLNLISNKVFDLPNCIEALNLFSKEHIDIILSDISMPNMNGIEFVKKVRQNNKRIPIILLTAHTDTPFLLEATKLKLVDYLVKPLDFNQLKEALIKASQEIYENGDYCIYFPNNICYNITEKKLYKDSKEQNISTKEISLLELLYKNKNRVVPTIEIKSSIWEDSFEATDSALKAVLSKLRKKIGKDSIRNVSGIGYQLQDT